MCRYFYALVLTGWTHVSAYFNCLNRPRPSRGVLPRQTQDPLPSPRGNLALNLALALLFVSCVGLSACCNLLGSQQSKELAAQPPELRVAAQANPRGVFIVIHGLNQKPDTMHETVELLNQLGYHTYRVSLRGHDQIESELFADRAWVEDLLNGCSLVAARFPKTPVYILGYSLGGLLATHVVDSQAVCNPAAMILIAPALSFRSFVQSGYLLSPFPPLSLSVPNIAPSKYRRFAQTPLFWYQNIFSLYSKTRTLRSPNRLSSIPTLVFANPRDELVSLSGLRTWLSNNSLERAWTLDVLRPQPGSPFTPEHVMIDRYSLGEHEWRHFSARIKNFMCSSQACNPAP
jgi:alpha-beta hydrolase superfamily lysophospholipase